MSRHLRRAVFLCVAGTVVLSNFVAGQTRTSPKPGIDEVLTRHVKTLPLQAPSLVDALLELGKHAKQPFGIEYIDIQELQKPLRVDVPDGTLDNALRAILAGRKGYSWHVEDGVVVVTHASLPKGQGNLLNKVLPSFSVARCSPQEAAVQLYMAVDLSLHPGIRGFAGDYSPGLWGKTVGPLNLTNITVREVLNRIASEARQIAWVIQVAPQDMDRLPSSGLWSLVDYEDASAMGHVGKLVRDAVQPFGK